MEAYRTLTAFRSDVDIPYFEFIGGYVLNVDDVNDFNTKRREDCRLELRFTTALPESVTVLVYGKFPTIMPKCLATMNNVELEELLKGYPVKVTCADELPVAIGRRPRTYAVNTDPCSRSGSHWIVFHFPGNGPCEFFDSLGRRPETYHRRFEYVLIANGPRYLYTPNRIQRKTAIPAEPTAFTLFESDIDIVPPETSCKTSAEKN